MEGKCHDMSFTRSTPGHRTRVRCWPLLVTIALASTTAHAGERRPVYWFSMTGVQVGKNMTAELRTQVEKEVTSQLAGHQRFVASLPAGAPDPGTQPAQFKQYLKKRGIQAFRVNVEVTEHEQRVEPLSPPAQGHHVSVRLGLRMLGENLPDRSLAFTGDGAAAIKMEVGKRVRPRDREVANREAITMAVKDALDRSIREIEAGPRKQAKSGRR